MNKPQAERTTRPGLTEERCLTRVYTLRHASRLRALLAMAGRLAVELLVLSLATWLLVLAVLG